MRRPFVQVDVFGAGPLDGNPVAVVLDADGLGTADMQRFARWTDLSETTFVLPPTTPDAGYRVRIFTPSEELPFAGHPTLGTAHAWLEAAGAQADEVVQECGAGLVRVRRTPDGLAFAAPPLVRSGPVDEAEVARIADLLGLARDEVQDAQWVDNGPGWMAVLLADADAVLAVRPDDLGELYLGVVGPHRDPAAADGAAIEVRALFSVDGATREDPVTGSLNASVAGWLARTGRVRLPYVARQGTAVGRHGRVHLSGDDDGTVWVAGTTRTWVRGDVDL